jgi:hypothetical protein
MIDNLASGPNGNRGVPARRSAGLVDGYEFQRLPAAAHRVLKLLRLSHPTQGRTAFSGCDYDELRAWPSRFVKRRIVGITSPSATIGRPSVAQPPARTSTSQGETRLSAVGVRQPATTPSSAADSTVSTDSDFTFGQNHVVAAATAKATAQISVSSSDHEAEAAPLNSAAPEISAAGSSASSSAPVIPQVAATVRNLTRAFPRK